MCDCASCNETEEQNSFWADVYYYMQEHQCDEKSAIKAVESSYRK